MEITVKIEKLGNSGAGQAMLGSKPVYVGQALPGELVRAKITHENSRAYNAELLEVIEKSAARKTAICRHFGSCGGCSLQHMTDDSYADFKKDIVRKAMQRAGFSAGENIQLLDFSMNTRRRANFKIQGEKIGFFASGTNDAVALSQCYVLMPEIFALMQKFQKFIAGRNIQQIQVTSIENGLDVILSSDEKFIAASLEGFCAENNIARISQKKSNGDVAVIFQREQVFYSAGDTKILLPPEYFLQAVKAAETAIIKFIDGEIGAAKNILDLFSGLGIYSFNLQAGRRVHAVEISTDMQQKILQTARENKLYNISAAAQNLDKKPVPAAELNKFDLAILNPPRTGALNQVKEIVASKLRKTIMVSCNPDTFARDIKILGKANFKLKKIQALDQFKFTPHLEIMAALER